jgi:hypothetical protein
MKQFSSSRVLNGQVGKMEAADFSETMVTFYHTARRHIPHLRNFQLEIIID